MKGKPTMANNNYDLNMNVDNLGEGNGNPSPKWTTESNPLTPEASSLIVTTAADVVDAYDGVTSLREAIAYANTLDAGATVTFADDFSIQLSSALSVSQQIVIDGGENNITIKGSESNQMFQVSNSKITLKNMALVSDYTGEDAGIMDLTTGKIVNVYNVTDSGNASVLWSFSGDNNGLSVYDNSQIHRVIINPDMNSWGTSGICVYDAILVDATVTGQKARDGGDIGVYDGGTLKNAVAKEKGDIYVHGGIAENVRAESNGMVRHVATDSIVKNMVVDFGGIYIYNSGVVLTGTISIAGTTKAYQTITSPIVSGTTDIVFDLTSRTEDSVFSFSHAHHSNTASVSNCAILIDNMEAFLGAGSYAIAVKSDQDKGTYRLAGNAGSFQSAMSLVVGNKTCDNALAVGTSYRIDGKEYSLGVNTNNELTLVLSEYDPLLVTTAADVVDAYDGVTSLREAIAYAESLGDTQMISFSLADGDNITISDPDLVNRNIRFQPINEATGNVMTVTLDNLSISNRNYHMRYDDMNVVVSGGEYSDNSISGLFGGAIRVNGNNATLIVDGATFSNNYAFSCGGAIDVEYATLTVQNSHFEGNHVNGQGGALNLYVTQDVHLIDTDFVNNSTGNLLYWCGGAIDLERGNMVFEVTAGKTITNVGNFSAYGGFLALRIQDDVTPPESTAEFRVNGTLIIGNGDGKDSFASYTPHAEVPHNIFIRKTGSGVMTINAPTSDYDEAWFIEDGVLAFSYASGGDFDGDITISGGQMQLGGAYTFNKLTFVLSEANQTAYLDNIANLTGGTFFADVTDAVNGCSYLLAAGASEFNGTISLVNSFGKSMGSLSVGQTVFIDGRVYSLRLSEDVLSVEIDIDSVAPAVTNVRANITAPTNQKVKVTATFSDNVALASSQFKIGEDGAWKPYSGGVTLFENGTVYFKAIDKAGNESEIVSYTVSNIDKELPTVTNVRANITALTNKNVKVTATFSDNVALASARYKIGENGTWKTYSGGVTLFENGTVYFKAIDTARNESEIVSYTVSNIDKELPTVTNVKANITAPTNKNVKVTATFSDNVALASSRYKIGENGTWKTYSGGVTLSENGTVYFKAIDTARNESEIVSYTVSNIDKVAPTVTSVTANITTPTTQKVKVTAMFHDDYALASSLYRIGENGTWKAYSGGVTMFENGTVYFKAVDASGNESEIASYTVSNILTSVQNAVPPAFSSEASIIPAPGTVNSLCREGDVNVDSNSADWEMIASGDFNADGNDLMHGSGENDVFTLCDNWGVDNVEQLAGGSAALWFTSGDESNRNSETLAYTDGENSIMVSGVAADEITLKFGDDGSEQFATLARADAFLDFNSKEIFEGSGKGILASL